MQKIQLSIPEPCHESWQQMSPTEQGRFCNACAKEVIDFSTMTDIQVLNYFSALTHEKVCGRVLSTQLEHPIERPQTPKKRLFWYWNYIAMFFIFFSKSNLIKAQTKGQVITSPIKDQTCTKTMGTMVSGVKVENRHRVISGKISDYDGNPIPSASVKLVGTKFGVSADENGSYSIDVTDEYNVIEISGAGYKTASYPVNGLVHFDCVLQKLPSQLTGDVVIIVGGMGYRNVDDDYSAYAKTKHVALFQIKDSVNGLPLDKATIIYTKISSNKSDTAFTDKKGIFKLKRIKDDDGYHVKVFTTGYQTNEFTISGNEFNERKETWEVFLKKNIINKSQAAGKDGKETHIRLGAISTIPYGNKPVYVLDGVITDNANDIDPNNIETITILKYPEATAIYGSRAIGGAIVMTSKMKEKILDTVKVVGSQYTTGNLRRIITCTSSIQKSNIQKDIVIKEQPDVHAVIYPNPVLRGHSFKMDITVQEPGNYNLQVVDANGQIVLQKQLHVAGKIFTSQIQTDSKWSSGIYFIRLFDSKNKPISTNSFVIL